MGRMDPNALAEREPKLDPKCEPLPYASTFGLNVEVLDRFMICVIFRVRV